MSVYELLPRLIRACLEFDKKNTEATALMIAKKIKREHPDVSTEITKALSYSGMGSSATRSLGVTPPPVDKDSRHSLVKISEPTEILDPILDEYVRLQLNDFIEERRQIDKFLDEGIVPPNSILLSGAPGVGKTYIAQWISHQLSLPLFTLDLASSISSYLGRSGQNIKSIFDYATSQPSILLLDELDAIAKRRDDASDLGELKRLVNVLLKELESCPSSCIIIGATNHPELLDKAIWRRFDRTLKVPMPEENERNLLMDRHLGKYKCNIGKETIKYLSINAANINAADICKLCEHIKRQIIMNHEKNANIIAFTELFKITQLDKRADKVVVCKKLKNEFPKLTTRDIAQITQIPLTSVQRYLKTEEVNNVES